MKWLLAPVIMLTASIGMAQNISQSQYVQCEKIGELGYNLMKLRQEGDSLRSVLDFLDSNTRSSSLNDLPKEIAIAAYQVPRSSNPNEQQRLMERFAEICESACLVQLLK